jgi:hypothetical protein
MHGGVAVAPLQPGDGIGKHPSPGLRVHTPLLTSVAPNRLIGTRVLDRGRDIDDNEQMFARQ